MDPANTNSSNTPNQSGDVENQTPPQQSSTPTSEPVTTPPPVIPTPKADPAPQVSTPMAGTTITEESKSAGPMVGSIIIIVIIIIGGLYFWGKYLTNQDLDLQGPTAEEISAEVDEGLTALEEQSSSDEIADIEADLDATDLEGLDEALSDIDLDF